MPERKDVYKWVRYDEALRNHVKIRKECCEVYTRQSDELNSIICELMDDYENLVKKAKSHGLDIRLHPGAPTLELYFHDDYPDTLLVDKYPSSERR